MIKSLEIHFLLFATAAVCIRTLCRRKEGGGERKKDAPETRLNTVPIRVSRLFILTVMRVRLKWMHVVLVRVHKVDHPLSENEIFQLKNLDYLPGSDS